MLFFYVSIFEMNSQNEKIKYEITIYSAYKVYSDRSSSSTVTIDIFSSRFSQNQTNQFVIFILRYLFLHFQFSSFNLLFLRDIYVY